MKRMLFTKTLLISVLASALLSFTACKSDEDKCIEGDRTACQQVLAKGTWFDKRDGKMYKIVKIGGQVWMAENLNYTTQDSYCYEDNESNCSKYGRLYKWNAAMKACPAGWHLPGNVEFKTLYESVGGKQVAGKSLKSKVEWKYESGGTDAFGFSALPAGYRGYDGDYYEEGYYAIFWSFTENNSNRAYFIRFSYNYNEANLYHDFKSSAFSVRCLQD